MVLVNNPSFYDGGVTARDFGAGCAKVSLFTHTSAVAQAHDNCPPVTSRRKTESWGVGLGGVGF
jgi:hypothetical protein